MIQHGGGGRGNSAPTVPALRAGRLPGGARTDGPSGAHELIQRDGRLWHKVGEPTGPGVAPVPKRGEKSPS